LLTQAELPDRAYVLLVLMFTGKGKGNVHPRTGHEGREGE